MIETLSDFEKAIFDKDMPSESIELSKKLKKYLESCDKEEIALFIKDIVKKNVSQSFPTGLSGYYCQIKILESLPDDILLKISYSKNLPYRIHIKILQDAKYDSIDIFDNIVLDEEYSDEVREHCARLCKQESLQKIVKDKSLKIREVVYSRMGAEYSIPYMIEDPKASIREAAAEVIPNGSDLLMKFVNDKSESVLKVVINKISLKEIPFFLGNKKVRNSKSISSILKKRLNKNV